MATGKPAGKQQRLEQLMRQTALTDADVAELATMKSARGLEFAPGVRLPQGTLKALCHLPIVQWVELPGTRVSAEDMAALARFPKLRRIDLAGTPLSAEHLRPLGRMPRLQDLWLESTGIRDADLSHLGKLPSLQWLILTNNPITDAGLTHLAAIGTLRTLSLDGTSITDAGLLRLAPLRKLTGVHIARTRATEAGKDALFKAQQSPARARAVSAPAPKADAAGLAEAKRVLEGFSRAMRSWEQETSRAHRRLGKDPSAAADARFERERTAAIVALFERFCTIRKRVYDDPTVLSWGSPSSYDPSRTTIVDERQPSASRIEITVKAEDEMRYLYVLLKKRGEWRIDHRKAWIDGGWSAWSLTL